MQASNPKVSVTVPVYNTSRYLRKCLDTLAAQTLKDIEVIMVDDGSTDDSGLICDQYAQQHTNFKVIHKPNGGLSTARQAGLEAATGEYIIVCDSDDWVEPDMYERLYKAAKESDADIAMCGFIAEYPDGKSVPTQILFKSLEWEAYMKELFGINYKVSWIRLVRRSLFTTNNISYEPGINMGEDWLILYKLMLTKPKITQIDAKLYHYRKELGGNSYTNNLNQHHIDQMKFVADWIRQHYNKNDYPTGFYLMDLDIAFSSLRSNEPDIYYIKEFLRLNMYWGRFFRQPKSLKALVVYSAKIISPSITSWLIKKLYKFVY